MAHKITVNRTCPLCKEEVYYEPGYNPKTATDHGGVEWIQTKRGMKQFLHTSCYDKMIKEHGSWY